MESRGGMSSQPLTNIVSIGCTYSKQGRKGSRTQSNSSPSTQKCWVYQRLRQQHSGNKILSSHYKTQRHGHQQKFWRCSDNWSTSFLHRQPRPHRQRQQKQPRQRHHRRCRRGWRRTITKWHISYVPLDPVADSVHMLDLNTRLRVGLKKLLNLKFKLKFQTQISHSNLNFKKLKHSLSSRVIWDSGKLNPRIKGIKAMKQWVGFQAKQRGSQGVGRRVYKIAVLPSCFHFVGSEE